MASKPQSYGEAHEQALKLLGKARLADPNEHFPYKHDTVTAVVEANPPMGPGIPGQLDGAEDESRRADDYITQGIADASKDYIDAQAAYLADPTLENRQAYDAARDRLQAARLDHRVNRGESFTVGAAARRAG